MKFLKDINEKAVSKAQQRLMGMAWAIRKGDLDPSDADDAAVEIANSKISDKDLEDYAKTKHAGLPNKKEEE